MGTSRRLPHRIKSRFSFSFSCSLSDNNHSTVISIFTILAFSYYAQLLDPTSAANASRAPSSQVRMGGFPSHYNPPYNAYPAYNTAPPPAPYVHPMNPKPYHPYPDQGYGYIRDRDDPFAPPYEVDGKPPGYVGAGTAGDDKSRDPFDDAEGPSRREEGGPPHRPAP